MIDIRGIDKARLLRALYDRAKPQGRGFLQYIPGYLDINEARQLIVTGEYIDYLHGRAMKVDLSGDWLDTRLYDRDNGNGAAAEAIASVLLDVD